MSESLLIKSRLREYYAYFINSIGPALKDLQSRRAFFIVDAKVWEIHAAIMRDIITADRILIVEANENNKTLDTCQNIIEHLVDNKFRRNEKIVAIGGGIIQDLAAFTSSILYRGVEWSFFPTTLLAQADSCIGSKTSINLGESKNLVGTFYPPSEIYIDTNFLSSLSPGDVKSGIGEILHYYIYSASPLINELIRDYAILISERRYLGKHIRESLAIKKSVVEHDEFDRGERNMFNYGHTFGHAIESITRYAINHGQAVTIGMDLANYVSLNTGLMRPAAFKALRRQLLKNFPDFDLSKIDIDRYFELLSKDKKNMNHNVVCILAKVPGDLIKHQLPIDDNFRNMVREYFQRHVPIENK